MTFNVRFLPLGTKLTFGTLGLMLVGHTTGCREADAPPPIVSEATPSTVDDQTNNLSEPTLESLPSNASLAPIEQIAPSEAASEASPALSHFGFRQVHMGMPVALEVYAPDRGTAEAAGRAAFARIGELDRILSDWNPDSELNVLCAQPAGTAVVVSDELFVVLEKAQAMAEASQGAFDPTAGPVIRLWRQARRDGVLPTADALNQALAKCGPELLSLDATHQTVTLARDGMQLDLGGIAKGYVGDEAIRILREHGIERCLYVAGGDIVTAGPPPGTTGWRIDPTHYADPGSVESGEVPILMLAHGAAAISGDTVQFVEIDGVRYSHVIDPRTGQAITTRRMCIVRAERGIDSDALATTGTVIDAAEHAELVAIYRARHWMFTAND